MTYNIWTKFGDSGYCALCYSAHPRDCLRDKLLQFFELEGIWRETAAPPSDAFSDSAQQYIGPDFHHKAEAYKDPFFATTNMYLKVKNMAALVQIRTK